MRWTFLFAVMSFNIWAEYPYEVPDISYQQLSPLSSFEVDHMPPVKDQSSLGLCYAFASTTLLENYRCQELNLNCNDPNNLINPLDVSSYNDDPYTRKIHESGYPYDVLDHFQQASSPLVNNNCCHYESIINQGSNQYSKSAKGSWDYLSDIWRSLKNKNFSDKATEDKYLNCLSLSIKKNITNLGTNQNQIKNALKLSNSLNEFMYQGLLPNQCLQSKNMISIPQFALKNFPENQRDLMTSQILANKIESLILNNIPVSVGICHINHNEKKCPNGKGHAIIASGIKEVCSTLFKKCKKLIKVTNSYGQNWNKYHNNGWVDLETLTHAILKTGESIRNLSWIQNPNKKLEEKRLPIIDPQKILASQISPPPHAQTENIIPSEWRNYKGVWKCPRDSKKFSAEYKPGCLPAKK